MEKATVGMTVRRSGARLRAMARTHGSLHVLIWQAREAQSTLLAAAAAQKTLVNDLAAWASKENRALNDVCSCLSEIGGVYTAALAHLAMAYKAFRKELGLVLEGEKRCDSMQKKLHEAEDKRIKLRRQVLRAQERVQTGEARKGGDFTALQTQLAESERTAERAHMESCAAAREQEAVKLVVVKSAITKLSESHLKLVSQTQTIFTGVKDIAAEIPEPPPPGDPVSCVRYSGYDNTKAVVERIKTHVNVNFSPSSSANRSRSSLGIDRPLSTSTPITSPNTSSGWSPDPTAPSVEPPPPYNMSYLRSKARRLSTRKDHCTSKKAMIENTSPSIPSTSTTSGIYPSIGNCHNQSMNSVSSVSSTSHLSQYLSNNLSISDNNPSTANNALNESLVQSTSSLTNNNSSRYYSMVCDDDDITSSPAKSNIF